MKTAQRSVKPLQKLVWLGGVAEALRLGDIKLPAYGFASILATQALDNRSGEARYSTEGLAALCGASKNSVLGYTGALETAGLIDVTRPPKRPGRKPTPLHRGLGATNVIRLRRR